MFFQKSLRPCALDESSFSIGRVEQPFIYSFIIVIVIYVFEVLLFFKIFLCLPDTSEPPDVNGLIFHHCHYGYCYYCCHVSTITKEYYFTQIFMALNGLCVPMCLYFKQPFIHLFIHYCYYFRGCL